MVAKRKIQLSKEARRLEILIRSLVVAGPEDNRTGSPEATQRGDWEGRRFPGTYSFILVESGILISTFL